MKVPAEHESAETREAVKRREDRNPTNWIATIRLPNGTDIPCNVKDVSKSGAKIGIPAYHELPETFYLRIIGRDFLCQVRLAWRRGDYAGVRIERVGKVPTPAATAKNAPPSPPPTSSAAAPPPEVEGGGIGIRTRRRPFSSF